MFFANKGQIKKIRLIFRIIPSVEKWEQVQQAEDKAEEHRYIFRLSPSREVFATGQVGRAGSGERDQPCVYIGIIDYGQLDGSLL